MVDVIDLLFNKVSLEANDDYVVVLDNSHASNDQHPPGLCLIGKMVMRKPANLESMKSALSRV